MEASSHVRESHLRRRFERSLPDTPAIAVELPAGPDTAQGARRAVGALRRHLDPDLLQRLRLLVSELVTNSVRHAGIEPGAPVRVELVLHDGVVRMSVTDRGRGFLPRPRHAEITVPGGWGLVLVEQLADRWGVANDGETRVWLEIDRRR